MLKTLHPTIGTSARENVLVISYVQSIDEIDLLFWLNGTSDTSRIYLENEQQQLAVAALGNVQTISATGRQRFEDIRQRLDGFSPQVFSNETVPPEAEPRWFGGFSFRSNHEPTSIWKDFPAAHFLLPQIQLTKTNGTFWLTLNDHLQPNETIETAEQRLQSEARGLIKSGFATSSISPTDIDIEHRNALMDESTWQELINQTTQKISQGDLEKVVLAQALQVQSKANVNVVEVLQRLKQTYNNCYCFLFEPQPGQAFFGATPELLAKVEDDTVETMAMASSIGRGKTEAEDQELANKLLASTKEQHEHQVVIEAIQRKLEPLTTELHIPDQPEIAKFSNIQHLKTNIRGKLSHVSSILSVLETLHPTPAMGGAPRQAALEWIETSEPFPRGWYASPVGWLDAQGNGMFVVAIRSAISSGQETQLFAGAGIVADSKPEREWAEIQLKFRPILEALGQS